MPKDIFAKLLEHKFEQKEAKKESKKSDEILANIFSFADADSLSKHAMTSKSLKNAVETKEAPILQLLVHNRVIGKAPFFKDETRKSLTEVRKFCGGLTNHMFKFKSPSRDDFFMARYAGKGTEEFIDRSAECANLDVYNQVGIGAEVVYSEAKTGNQITRFIENLGTLFPADFIDNPDLLKEAITLIKKLNEHPILFKNDFKVFDRCRKAIDNLVEIKISLPEKYQLCEKEINKIEELLNKLDIRKVPCHNDANPYNFLKLKNGKLKLIDPEYAGNGDAMMDLANFVMELTLNSIIELKDQGIADKLKKLEPQVLQLYGVTDEYDYQRYVLWKPVVEYWWALWAKCRLVSETQKNEIAILEMVEKRIDNCKDLINSPDYHDAFNALMMRTEKRCHLS